jgi:hypothetical protein
LILQIGYAAVMLIESNQKQASLITRIEEIVYKAPVSMGVIASVWSIRRMRSRTRIVRSMGFGGDATNEQVRMWGTTCIACQECKSLLISGYELFIQV